MKNSIYKSQQGKEEFLVYYDNLLKDWCSPSHKYFIETPFGETFIIEAGEKTLPKMILLHGSGSNSAMWKANVQKYTQEYNVFAIDIVGECGKSSENRPDFEKKAYAEWLNEICSSLKIDRVVVVGCSMGGWLATAFALHYPKKTEALILIATGGVTNIKFSMVFWVILTSLFGDWGFNKLNRKVYGGLEIDDESKYFITLIKHHFKPRTDILPLFTDEELERISSPTFFIGGDNDCFYSSHKTEDRLSNCLMNFQSEILENTGHVIIDATQPIDRFLNSVRNPSLLNV